MSILLGRLLHGQPWLILAATGALSIAGTELPPDQVYSTTGLGGASAPVAVSAAYTGTAASLQASVVNYGTATQPAGATWQPVSASGGTVTGTISVPAGGPYALTFRDNSASWTSTQRIFAGDTGVLYGQSNMDNLANQYNPDGSTNVHSQTLARKQVGGGWNVVSSLGSEGNFPGAPPLTVFNGLSYPNFNPLPGEIYTTRGKIGVFANQMLANMGGSRALGLHPYAVGGTDAQSWDPSTGSRWAEMMAAFRKAPFAFNPSFAVRHQGEANTQDYNLVNLQTGLGRERDGWWAVSGRNAATFRFGLISLGPQNGYNIAQAGYFGQARLLVTNFVATASNGAYYAANPIDVTLGDGVVHYDLASYDRMARRMALTTAIALGRTMVGSTGTFTTGAGPRANTGGITRVGNVITVPMADMDGSTALVDGAGGTPGTSIAGFRVWSGAAGSVAISGAAVGNVTPSSVTVSGASVVITLPAGTAYPVSIDNEMADLPYGGTTPVAPTLLRGNNIVPGDTVGLPLWPFGAVTVP